MAKGSKKKFLAALLKKEKGLEAKGGKKTKKEIGLEKLISKVSGKRFLGKR